MASGRPSPDVDGGTGSDVERERATVGGAKNTGLDVDTWLIDVECTPSFGRGALPRAWHSTGVGAGVGASLIEAGPVLGVNFAGVLALVVEPFRPHTVVTSSGGYDVATMERLPRTVVSGATLSMRHDEPHLLQETVTVQLLALYILFSIPHPWWH